MGHSTAFVDVKKNLNQVQNAVSILNEAVRNWIDNEADRYDDSRAGRAVMTAPMTQVHMNRFLEENQVNDSVSYVIPQVAPENIVTSSRKVKLTLNSVMLDKVMRNDLNYNSGFMQLLVKEFGNEINSFKVLKTPAKRKAVAVTTEGKMKIVYTVYGVADGQLHRVTEGFDSQAAARAAAIEIANSDDPKYTCRGRFYGAFEVHPSMLRESGEKAVVRVTNPVSESGTVELQIEFKKIKPNAKITHYVAVFDYHH